MPISRGSIRHTLLEDVAAAVATTLNLGDSCGRAGDSTKMKTVERIRDYLNAEHITLFPFARTALFAVLKSLDLPKGSEVLMTPINIGPMCEVVQSLGLKPCFVDLNPDDLGPALDELEQKLANQPAVFLLTYLFGIVPDTDRIARLCHAHNVFLIEDFSQNIGAEQNGKKLGTFGDAAIYSASLLKYLDGFNGGFVVSSNKDLQNRVKAFAETLLDPDPKRIKKIVRKTLIWNFALSRYSFSFLTYPTLLALRILSKSTFDRILGPSIQTDLSREELPTYYFEDIAEIQCEMICRCLERLDKLVEQRTVSAIKASEAFGETIDGRTPHFLSKPIGGEFKNTYWQIVVPIRNPDTAKAKLFSIGVETGTTNLPDLSALYDEVLPTTNKIRETYLFIPMHHHLKQMDYRRVFRLLKENDLVE